MNGYVRPVAKAEPVSDQRAIEKGVDAVGARSRWFLPGRAQALERACRDIVDGYHVDIRFHLAVRDAAESVDESQLKSPLRSFGCVNRRLTAVDLRDTCKCQAIRAGADDGDMTMWRGIRACPKTTACRRLHEEASRGLRYPTRRIGHAVATADGGLHAVHRHARQVTGCRRARAVEGAEYPGK